MTVKQATATFAGGCFWCMVMPFDCYEGVLQVVSGYTGGHLENPSYQEVKAGESGHLEAVQITFNPQVISYSQLLEIFWQQIDPTDDGGQFGDRGAPYRTAIFCHDHAQQETAEAARQALQDSSAYTKPIVTRILPATTFYRAEEYHQDYARKEPQAYAADAAVQERKRYIQQRTTENI